MNRGPMSWPAPLWSKDVRFQIKIPPLDIFFYILQLLMTWDVFQDFVSKNHFIFLKPVVFNKDLGQEVLGPEPRG